MIRQATAADLAQIEDAYDEHFAFETAHPERAFTVFRKGVYPTRRDAEKALADGGLTVFEEDGRILASVITSGVQPPEYAHVPWQRALDASQVRVIHLLMVRPSAAGRGIGATLMRYIEAQARAEGIRALRLDTGSQNKPAVGLYTGQGFTLAGTGSVQLGGQIPHAGQVFLEHAV